MPHECPLAFRSGRAGAETDLAKRPSARQPSAMPQSATVFGGALRKKRDITASALRLSLAFSANLHGARFSTPTPVAVEKLTLQKFAESIDWSDPLWIFGDHRCAHVCSIFGGFCKVCITTQYCSVFACNALSCSSVACGALTSKMTLMP
jgi:hypothetical protein